MGRVLTNNTGLAYAIEQTPGNLPVSPTWRQVEPNSYGTFGASITTVARQPISRNRQRRKGTPTDLDANAEFETDLILSHFIDFMEGYVFSTFQGVATYVPSSVSTTAYTVASGAVLAQRTLVFARGFTNSANNGLKVVNTGATATSIPITGGGLVVEATPPSNAVINVAGFRGASGDIEINSDGNIISTTLDFTTLDLTAGQVIHVGGANTANQFDQAANTGYARIVSIAANLLTIDKTAQTFVTDDGSGKEIDLLFGRYLRNVPTDDADFLERSFQFELFYPGLDNPTGDRYGYLEGNYCNQVTFNLPLTDKATCNWGFVGLDSQPPVTTRRTGADTQIAPNRTGAFNTSSDIARIGIRQDDGTLLTSFFKSLNLTINNNVTPEKVLGQLGAAFINVGNLEVNVEAQLIFTDAAIAQAVRDNTTLTMDFTLTNDDGAIFVDIPSITLGGGDQEFPVNESVLINTTAEAFADATFNTSLGISLFPYIP